MFSQEIKFQDSSNKFKNLNICSVSIYSGIYKNHCILSITL